MGDPIFAGLQLARRGRFNADPGLPTRLFERIQVVHGGIFGRKKCLRGKWASGYKMPGAASRNQRN